MQQLLSGPSQTRSLACAAEAVDNITQKPICAGSCVTAFARQSSHYISLCLQHVTGPTVRVFGWCLTGSGTVLCEPLSAAMDMLLIPHRAQRFAELASLFWELPQMVSGLKSPLALYAAL